MEEKKTYIGLSVMYGALAVLFVVVACIFAHQGVLACVIIYATASVSFGAFFGIWLCKAISYEDDKSNFLQYCAIKTENLDLRESLEKAKIGIIDVGDVSVTDIKNISHDTARDIIIYILKNERNHYVGDILMTIATFHGVDYEECKIVAGREE